MACLDQQGFYRPAMALIITSQEQFKPVYGGYGTYSRDGLHSEIHFAREHSHCEAQNNYTMEFEYIVTTNASTIDRSVVVCGVSEFDDWPPNLQCTCWGQSYGIIHYNHELDTLAYYTVAMASTTTEGTQAHTSTDVRTTPDSITSIKSTTISAMTAYFPSVIYSRSEVWVSTLLSAIIVIIIIIILLLTIGFLRLKSVSHRRLNVIAPQCVQTVEQTLVIKVEQPSDSEKEVKEKETSLDEDSNLSPVQAQLQQKLPDIISSRSKTL